MTGSDRNRFAAILFGGLVIAVAQACDPLHLVPLAPGAAVVDENGVAVYTEGTPLVTYGHERYATEGGTLTVDVTVFAGPQPDANMSTSGNVLIARFSNRGDLRGDGDKQEKRYKLKPKKNNTYDLVLSRGDAGRTKWTLYRKRGIIITGTHATGHLWICDPPHSPPGARVLQFKHCSLPVQYNPEETVAVDRQPTARFAGYSGDAFEGLQAWLSAPVWISCNSGCCSLGE